MDVRRERTGAATRSRGARWAAGVLAVAAVGLIPTVLVAPAAAAHGGTSVRVQDECETTSFNAALGPGTCVGDGDGDGNVTFAKFSEKLNPKDGGHGAWRFDRREAKIRLGESVHVTNEGGEVHSFSEVSRFGTVGIPPLDAALPNGSPTALPVGDPGPTFLQPGETLHIHGLSAGTHKFECLIHPWMRSTIEVRR
ncbi:cupredoxin domain-containing protein [Pseudonocardia bannensis]|uniref:Uncharacterized protein n=1 Tax=Pseudonocardia bannensis TaxID=630973 RepID=A0A848DJ99_9PSEU|nr:hypothetical protein [Pseudonocardia bannensis]NMH92780.1 hypothetical protein [Pseudonocardia bannensis]